MTAVALYDVNCQLGQIPWGTIGFQSVDDLHQRMDQLGIRRAIVSHTMAWQHDPAVGNRRVLDELRGADRLRPCWVALPQSCGELPPPDEFAAQAGAAGVAAVRVYPDDHGFDLDGPDFAGYAAACVAAGLPLLVGLAQTSWPAVERLAATHPTLPILVCDTGYRVLRRAAGVLDRCPNVRLDLSDLSTHEGLEWVSARFGPHRLVFGTGAPLRDGAEAVARLLWSDLDDDAVAQIAHRNLDALLAGGSR